MIRKLQIKFVCVTMVLVTVLLVLMMTMQYRSASRSLEIDSLDALRTAATAPMTMNRPGDGAQPCFGLLLTGWGELKVTQSAYYDLSDKELLREIFQQAWNSGAQSGVLTQYSLRFLRSDAAMGTLLVFTDISAELQILKELARNCVLIGIFSFFCFLALCILLSRWMVRPVEKAWQEQRQFVADASHELKTPLTVILTNAELLQDESCESEEKRQFTGNILAMSHQMRGLVESLLQLARADSGQTKAEVRLLDFSRLVEDAVLPFEPMYFEQGLMLESSIEPGLRVSGSESHLRQVVEILLDNGRKYSDPGGTAVLTLTRQSRNQCILKISTPGRELTARELTDIFKRFYRADEARSMNHSYGLGLSIAQRIVSDHRGKIWAESGDGRNIFCVTLPLA